MVNTGQKYLEDIRANLKSGHFQHRMGQNVLRAFGYVRRRATAIEEINATLEKLRLVANPPINAEMPLRKPRIRFSLMPSDGAATPEDVSEPETPNVNGFDSASRDADYNDSSLPEPAFSISELASAKTDVECVPLDASIQTAYITMLLGKYSQLVVASKTRPRQQDIKGVVSFQSMAKALMNGKPTTVGDCIDKDVPFAQSHDDLQSVIRKLSGNDVVLVIGRDKRLQGIVTAWDLAEEFAELVDPFKRIGEIEERLRALVQTRLGKRTVAEFLKDQGLRGDSPIEVSEELTMGALERVLDFPQHWDALGLVFDRAVFIGALDEIRDFRNRLMHFRDPLTEAELTRLTNFCDAVREIQL